jgi:K+-sensing histidine kinase KdpD
MSGFVLGIIIGCFAGALGTLVLLLVVYQIPDGDYFHSHEPVRWRSVTLIVALMIASAAAFTFLDLRRVAFATSILLLLVLIAAHMRGLLISWIALAIAALALCLILPPAQALTVGDPQDRILLVFFILCGAVGTRLIAHSQRA